MGKSASRHIHGDLVRRVVLSTAIIRLPRQYQRFDDHRYVQSHGEEAVRHRHNGCCIDPCVWRCLAVALATQLYSANLVHRQTGFGGGADDLPRVVLVVDDSISSRQEQAQPHLVPMV